MTTKDNPGPFDCYGKAESGEPMFILMARDATAPRLVRKWAKRRLRNIAEGIRPVEDVAQVREALECAKSMSRWRQAYISRFGNSER